MFSANKLVGDPAAIAVPSASVRRAIVLLPGAYSWQLRCSVPVLGQFGWNTVLAFSFPSVFYPTLQHYCLSNAIHWAQYKITSVSCVRPCVQLYLSYLPFTFPFSFPFPFPFFSLFSPFPPLSLSFFLLSLSFSLFFPFSPFYFPFSLPFFLFFPFPFFTFSPRSPSLFSPSTFFLFLFSTFFAWWRWTIYSKALVTKRMVLWLTIFIV